jgi:hypothetical protein
MDFQEQILKENPREKANILSSLFFVWLQPLFRKGTSLKLCHAFSIKSLKLFKGYKSDLGLTDLYNVLKEDESEKLGDQLQRYHNH